MAYNSQWGLTATGFYVPTYQEILSQVEDEMISAIDPDLVVTSNSNAGILARIFARREKAQWEQQQLTYYSAFISTASDASLDYIGGNLGLKRKVDEPAFAQIEITTQEEYLIQAGEQYETEEGYVFTLLKDVLTKKKGDGSWSGIGWVQCEDTGQDTNVPANSITVEVNPDDEIISITNPEKAGGGQDYEDDETYRERLRMENAARPGSTAAGIRSALMNLPGVREVNIIQNPFADPDKYGNPPYSVHIYCLGSNKQDIAECLADYIAAGITMVGRQELTVRDATGNPLKINFDFATEKPIYAKVTVSVNDAWNIDEGAENVKYAIAEYISGLEMGDPLYITRLYPAVYSIEGISDATIEVGLAPDQLAEKDIKQKDFEAPICSPDNVEVTVNGL
ncbi:baseplate J/gp47 family protein [Lactobacillus xujianguonis]|uniref:baseplate J/gp47 family protein n=1 Tax=Lactobacillus xujianguonis TaxID=2495899 RepID=UPI000FD79B3C|nr:baseplate J/gp47 family protein [Lactobacillus xujianguonis]RVU73465.1 baseplate J/gp47 family protein [Lactobacillus xujianguonis]